MLKTPLIPLRPNHNTQILFVFLFGLIYFCLFAFMIPSNSYCISIANKHDIFAWAILVLAVVVLISLVGATVLDPGVLRPDTRHNLIDVL